MISSNDEKETKQKKKSTQSYKCQNCCVSSSKTLADRMLDAICYSAIYAQSGIKSLIKSPHDALPEHAKKLLRILKNEEDEQRISLETLERKIRDFRDRNRSFFTDLTSKQKIEDEVRRLKETSLTQTNAMKTFDLGQMFLAADDDKSREETSKEILRMYDRKKGVASCLFECEAEDAEELRKMIREHEESQCEWVEVKCERCDERFSKKFRKRHDEKVCPLFEVECPLKCGTVLKRNQVDLHAMNRCENRAYECPYEKLDCCSPTEPITKKTFDAHVRDNCANHLFTVTQKLFPKLSVLEHEHVRLEKQLHDHSQTNSRNHEKLKRFSEDELKWTKNNFGHVETRLKAAEMALEKERRDTLALMKRIETLEKAIMTSSSAARGRK
jgi:hypothetical protein